MKRIKLCGKNGVGKYALVDDEDFEKLNQWRWYFNSRFGGYAETQRHIKVKNGKQIMKSWQMHRFIMDTPDNLLCDHKNGDKLDNRKSNLRNCNRSQNAVNSKLRTTNKSGYVGVSWCKIMKKWRAYIVVNYKQTILGYFNDKKEAAKAYDKAAIKHFGEFARLNNV